MKNIPSIFVILLVVVSASSSGNRAYKTAKGKKKLKYYNDIQFGGKSASQMKAP